VICLGIDDSFHKGLKAYRDGNYQEAIQLFRVAVSDNEGNHKAWNALGVTYSKTGNIEEAVTCYENALKYDPGNISYEQNRDQIVHKALSQLPVSVETTLQKPVAIDYQRFIIPSVALVFIVLLTLFMIFAAPGLMGGSQDAQEKILDDPVILPAQTSVSPSPQLSVVIAPDEETNSSTRNPDVSDIPVTDDSSFMIIGDLIGKYYNGLSEVTFTVGIPEGKSPQYLPRVSYLWSAGMLDPIPVLPSNPASGTLKPGDIQLVTLQIPLNQQPRAGEKYRLEIRPVVGTGQPTILESQLPEDYNGGTIINPISYASIEGSGHRLSDEGTSEGSSSTSSGLNPNIMLDGSISGFYSSELEELTFTLRTDTTGMAQDLTRIQYILTTGDDAPVTLSKANPAKGTINPGEQQLISVRIPEGYRPRAGDTITFEIKPDVGRPIILSKVLSSAYKGGVI